MRMDESEVNWKKQGNLEGYATNLCAKILVGWQGKATTAHIIPIHNAQERYILLLFF